MEEAQAPKPCKTCRWFYQHYVRLNRKYSPIASGHCPWPHLRNRKADAPACERWEAKKERTP